MKKLCLSSLLAVLMVSISSAAVVQEPLERSRTPIRFPDIPGFVTLKCDFHMHTIFSDGLVWPTIRVEEAWRDGLDAIAITDHLEYQPHKADVNTNHNRSFEIAAPAGNDLDLLVVKGSEVTRAMPPGHLNAIFLKDSTPLAVPDWRKALAAAHEQGAFIFWNHPGSGIESPSGERTWFPEHAGLLKDGMLQGIEVVNGRYYFPEAHRWAIEHKLTMLSNSDAHNPTGLDYQAQGTLRPITLVFAKDHTVGSLKEALLARRTAVYAHGRLIGDEEFLRPIFDRSVEVLTPKVSARGSGRKLVQIANKSGIDITLELAKSSKDFAVPSETRLAAGKVVVLQLTRRPDHKISDSTLNLKYRVANFLCGPEKPLEVEIKLDVEK